MTPTTSFFVTTLLWSRCHARNICRLMNNSIYMIVPWRKVSLQQPQQRHKKKNTKPTLLLLQPRTFIKPKLCWKSNLPMISIWCWIICKTCKVDCIAMRWIGIEIPYLIASARPFSKDISRRIVPRTTTTPQVVRCSKSTYTECARDLIRSHAKYHNLFRAALQESGDAATAVQYAVYLPESCLEEFDEMDWITIAPLPTTLTK